MTCYVKNAHNTLGDGSMIAQWEDYTGKKCPTYCSNTDCNNKLDDRNKCGAHVFKCDKNGCVTENYKRYIVPLCKECNHTTNKDAMRIKSEDLLVPLSDLE